MRTVTATEASRGFSALLDRIAEDSDPILITRDGREVAVLQQPTALPQFTWGAAKLKFKNLPKTDSDFGPDILAATSHLIDQEFPWRDD
jgi:prevent-host-death family protein